jgi:hypothetical protein
MEHLRSTALIVAFREPDAALPMPFIGPRERSPTARYVKLSVRVSMLVAHRLDLHGRATGLSRAGPSDAPF